MGRQKGAWRPLVGRSGQKKEAQQRTLELARKRKAQVIVHGRNGRMEEERTFPRNSDPRRYKS